MEERLASLDVVFVHVRIRLRDPLDEIESHSFLAFAEILGIETVGTAEVAVPGNEEEDGFLISILLRFFPFVGRDSQCDGRMPVGKIAFPFALVCHEKL